LEINIIIMTSNNNSILCVICKIKLDKIEQFTFKCPKCHNKYNLYYEIQEHENEFGSSHDDSAEEIELSGLEAAQSGPTLLTADDDELDFDEEEEEDDSDIPIPKYMQSSTTTEVIEYREE
jgi:hypothetical protein